MSELLIETRGQSGWLILNRPKAFNSLTRSILEDLAIALSDFEQDDNIRVIVLAATDCPAFCAGADLMQVLEKTESGEKDFLMQARTSFGALRNCSKPVVAAINGMTMAGGLELTMCCDIVIASNKATFGDAHANFGVFPGAGGAAILPKLVPVNVAKYLLFTGKSLPASEMKQYGLVNEVVEHEQLNSRVQELCDDLAEKSPVVLQRMKKIANQAQDQTRQSALDSELLELREHLLSADIQEGLAAFSEKRKPVFIGK